MTDNELEFTNMVADTVRIAYDEGSMDAASCGNIMWRLGDCFAEAYRLDFNMHAFIMRCKGLSQRKSPVKTFKVTGPDTGGWL